MTSLSRRAMLEHLAVVFGLPLLARGPLHRAWIPMSDDPLQGTIAAYQAGRAAGAYTAEQVTRRALERCDGLGQRLRAIDLLADGALAAARASDARLRRAALRGPLDGVPVFAKSIYDVRGTPTTASSAEWARLFPRAAAADAIEVARLRAAGAVILGKTAADDFAYRGNGTSSHTGQVLNPYDASGRKTPGGSSAGSAVAVACGLAFCALGTDDGGSNRIPAQFSGVVGMKPTFGLVPRTGVLPTWPVLDTHGPLARFVADAALMLDVLAGPHAGDGLALATPWRSGMLARLSADALRGVRLGVVAVHAPRDRMSATSLAMFDRALADCTRAGAEVVPFEPASDRVTYREHFATLANARGDVAPNANAPAATANALLRYFAREVGAREAPAAVRRGLAAFRAFYDVLPTAWSDMERLIVQPYEQDAASRSFLRSREQVVAQLGASMRAQRIDVMVYPTMPFPAPAAADSWPDIRTPLGYGNWLGLPEVSVPSGHDEQGLPAGNLSFVGLPGSDAAVLAMAHAYEVASQRFVSPPG